MGRRQRWFLLALATAASAVLGFVLSGNRIARAVPECPPGPVIVIDPGHGGIDGGTNLPGVLEKDLVLDIGLRLKEHLQQNNVNVVLTRATDVDLGGRNDSGRLRRDLNYRSRVANRCDTVLMLSLHVNSSSNASEQGVMIFYQPTHAGRDAAYLFDGILRRWPIHDRQERPYPRRRLAILRATRAPALLIELGFITNPLDRSKLTDPGYREQVARALASACQAVFQNWAK